MTIAQIHENTVRKLQLNYSANEAKSISYALLQYYGQWPRTHIFAFPETEAAPEVVGKIEAAVVALQSHRPLQYVIGETLFCGFTFAVSEAALIPRPETEELVYWVAKEMEEIKNPAIADLCTGSGCIAVALAKLLPDAAVYACDISGDALKIATHNAIANVAAVHFFQCDILSSPVEFPVAELHCIVSNPPYVRLSEKEKMNANVLLYEPHLALFVDDCDPLLFYRSIAAIAQQKLAKDGRLFVEINEELGEEVKDLLSAAGFAAIELRQDINNKNRMVKAVKA